MTVRRERLPSYAAGLPAPGSHPPPVLTVTGVGEERRAAFHLVCDAINFGSGWFPTLRKRDGRSGSYTVMLAVRDSFSRSGAWDAAALSGVTAAEVAAVLGQDPRHELMALYATHLQELGRNVAGRFGGSFLGLARHPRLADELAGWPGFHDVAHHRGEPVPFYKRAQLTAYEMACAGFVAPGSEGDLTMFADNLVPHVLRVDGVLQYDDDLAARIAAGELLEPGGEAEVEIRACGLHAVELIVAQRPDLTAPAVDQLLWHRGQAQAYKALPRHRARCEAY